jgi:hypothetical protein
VDVHDRGARLCTIIEVGDLIVEGVYPKERHDQVEPSVPVEIRKYPDVGVQVLDVFLALIGVRVEEEQVHRLFGGDGVMLEDASLDALGVRAIQIGWEIHIGERKDK